jgi:hypothetical protein
VDAGGVGFIRPNFKMKKILFVCASKQVGGAEKQLLLLAKELSTSNSVAIFLFGKTGSMESQFIDSKLNLEVHSGSKLTAAISLAKKIMCERPQVQVNWLYEADIIGGIIGKLLGVPILVNSARNTDWPGSTRIRKFLLRLSATFIATHVVANSQRALKWHVSIGYPIRKMIFIPNLLSQSQVFPRNVPNLESKNIIRLGIASRPVFGKGHLLLLDAILQLPLEMQTRISCTFIGFDLPKSELASEIKRYPVSIELLDGKYDLADWFESIDIYCGVSDSWESDSNSINEAVLNNRLVIASDLIDSDSYSPPINTFESGNSKDLGNKLNILIGQSQASISEAVLSRRSNLINSRNPKHILNRWKDLFEVRD